jgi:cytochrome c
MKVRIAIVSVLMVWSVSVMNTAARMQEVKTTRSVWDGVYTEEQAKRGGQSYADACSMCHGEALQGDGFAAPLSGTTFMSNWDGLTLGDLFERMRISMPPDAPSAVTREAKVDILAYVLKFNQFPAGQTELERETEKMKQIKFEATKPKGH